MPTSDRGRDLKINVLSDVERFRLDKPAQDLEDLGRAADDASRDLDRAERSIEATKDAAGDLERATKDGGESLDDLGKDAKDTARDVDRAFEKIAASSKANLRKKLDDDTDKAGDSLRDVRDEANDTAREMGASFDGSIESVMDGFQELGANAGVAFGPIGIAIGAAAAVGVGVIRAEAEKLKELTGEMVEEMIEAGGKLSDEFIAQKLEAMAADGTLLELQAQAESLGLSFVDLARAKAGDTEAADRLLGRIAELSSEINKNAAENGTATGEMYAQQTALTGLAGEIRGTAKAHELATRAISALGKATTGAKGDTVDAAHVMGAEWDDLRGNLGRPIRAKVVVDGPKASEIDAVNRAIRNGIGTIVVPVKPGTSKYANNANNSRYRN